VRDDSGLLCARGVLCVLVLLLPRVRCAAPFGQAECEDAAWAVLMRRPVVLALCD